MTDISALRPYATQVQADYLDAIEQHGGQRAAARALGIGQSAIANALARLRASAALRGYAPTHDMTHPVAPGFIASGVSTYYNKDGQPTGQWVKARADHEQRRADFLSAVEGACEAIKPFERVKQPAHANADLATLYTITDFHHGLYAWKPETGADWDMDIASSVLLSAMGEMIDGSPAADLGIFAQMGDYLHWDGLLALTPTSNHVLDADTRFDRLAEVVITVLCQSVEMLLAKHKRVHVLMCEGNHDIASSVWLRKIMKVAFRGNPRVTVDDTPFPFYAYLHGEIMLAFHHGHRVKNKSLPALFSSEPRYRAMWGQARYTYVHTGHYHHAEQDMAEHGGAIVERHPTLAARDAYATRGGYVSWRAAKAITYHKTKGEVSRKVVIPDDGNA